MGRGSDYTHVLAGLSAVAGSDAIQQESLDLLDWPAVCRQVACFASTPMAAEELLCGSLPMGRTQVRPLPHNVHRTSCSQK